MDRPGQFGGSWTEEKLDCLSKYLHAYTTIFTRNPRARYFDTFYVDAFAGSGKILTSQVADEPHLFQDLADPETERYLKGSASRALEVEPPFKNYLFVDNNPERCRQLEELKKGYPHRAPSVEIKNADANQFLKRWCSKTDWKKTRAVVFLDPFAMQVEWSLLQAIGATEAIDLWLLFPCMAFTRLLQKKGPPPEKWKRRLTAIAGTEAWEDAFYPSRQIATLFGEEEIQVREAGLQKIGAFFLDRLKTIFAGVARVPLVLKNSRNSPLFMFCFAVGNKKGAAPAIKIAQDIIGKES